MASSSGSKYPRRLYDVGKTPIQSRSMNHSCFLANVQTVLESVGDDVVSDLRESAVGVINGNHWVALHIDLLKSTTYVYDCIPDVVKAHKDLQEECRPFTKMIPLILNKMLPPTKGKKSEQQFALRRPKNVPRNDDPGDCGVYSLKYIECLAIGCTFHGLSDEIIPAQRMKLAAEIYEEVAEVDAEGSI